MFIKSRFLNTSAMMMLPDNEGGAALTPEQEREAITVETSVNKEEPSEVETTDEKDEDGEEDSDGEEEKEELVEETEEEKTERLAKEREAKKDRENRREERRQRKFDKLAAERNAALEENERLKKQIAENNPDGLTEEEVERRAEAKAAAKLQEQELARQQREFDKNVKDLELSAKKVDPKFNEKLDNMIEDLDRPIPGSVISILSDLDHKNGGEVLNYLTENLDEADDIFDLSLHKMTQKLIRISDKLKETKKDKNGKTVRKPPPPPLNTVRETGKAETNILTGKESMDDFVRIRERQSEQYRKSKGGW